jgi:hypothetical protein
MGGMRGSHKIACILLGCIRLLNGSVALVAPQLLCRNIGIDPDATPAALYVFRMFGIRTVLIALDVLFARGPRQVEAINRAPVIHASDTMAAAIAAASGRLPGRSGTTIVAISAVNTALALWARNGLDS